jgi:hypothetical protein
MVWVCFHMFSRAGCREVGPVGTASNLSLDPLCMLAVFPVPPSCWNQELRSWFMGPYMYALEACALESSSASLPDWTGLAAFLQPAPHPVPVLCCRSLHQLKCWWRFQLHSTSTGCAVSCRSAASSQGSAAAWWFQCSCSALNVHLQQVNARSCH